MPEYVYKSGRVSFSSGRLKRFPATMQVSVIIPTYNEESNIERLVKSLSSALRGFDYEIVVVDDASRDRTPEIIDRLSLSGRVSALHREGVKGIFSALIDGVRVARGNYIVIMDADFSHPPEYVPVLVREAVKSGCDIVAGSRFLRGSVFIAPFARRVFPTLLNALCRFILGIKVTDVFTGFHAMKKERFLQIRFRYPSEWGEFDMELLFKAQGMGFSMKDVPFSYRYRERGVSKSSGMKIVRYAFVYLRRAIQLRVFG
ncbi:polyprenol monophosphomannose synthase [Candidatus Woesearchaeota archaeon]|nr:polyprenol monophosphomannose synthase [Candidatus Woesearchaeota archaeon]